MFYIPLKYTLYPESAKLIKAVLNRIQEPLVFAISVTCNKGHQAPVAAKGG